MSFSDLRSALLPTKYISHKSKNIKLSFLMLLCVYVIMFVCLTFSVIRLVVPLYDQVSDFVKNTNDFYFADGTLHHDGKYSSYIDKLDLTLTVDGKASYANPPECESMAFIFIGNDGFNIQLGKDLSIEMSTAELIAQVGPFSFDKALILEHIDYGRYVISNLITSTAVLLAVLLAIVLFMALLVVALIVKYLCKLLKLDLSFTQILFIVSAGAVYPTLLLGLLVLLPNGLWFAFKSNGMMLRLLAAGVLLYIIAALYPIQGQNASSKKE